MVNAQRLLDKTFKDKNGTVVISQPPNLPLIGWIVFEVASLLAPATRNKTFFRNLALASLFTWASMETIKGADYFRKLSGLAVVIIIIRSKAKRR